MTGVSLLLLAAVLSWAVPDLLSRAAWLERAPRAGVVLWQAVALAAVLSALGAVLAAPEEALRAWQGTVEFGPALLLAAGIAGLLAGVIILRLVWVGLRLGMRTRKRRARHAQMLELVETDDPVDLRMHVLSGAIPMAYCLPGRSNRVVITDTALELLTVEEVDAVVEHERAHLRARHDLVLEAFTSLHASFPRVVRSRAALDAVQRLLEMLADDAAVVRVGRNALVSALRTLGPTADGGHVSPRINRLAKAPAAQAAPRLLAVSAYVLAVAVLALPTLVLVGPWLQAALPAIWS